MAFNLSKLSEETKDIFTKVELQCAHFPRNFQTICLIKSDSQSGKTREGDCTQLTEGKSLRNTLKAEKKPASDMRKRFIKKLGQTIRNFAYWTSFLRYSAIHFTYEQLNCKELRLRFGQKKFTFLYTYYLIYVFFTFLYMLKRKFLF